ncbi:MAG: YtxH domain-containing protein, partial [Burkholderiales bacterium]
MARLLLIGAAIGGAVMYLFDPDQGRRRRALIRDQAVRAQSNVKDLVEAGTRDLQNRGTALAGRTWSWVRRR